MTKCLLVSLAAATLWLPVSARAEDSAPKIRVLLVTGGHGYDKEPFLNVFRQNPEITFEAVEHPAAHARLTAEGSRNWDVLVLYDLWQPITDTAKADLQARLKEGKGVVALHHSLASYQAWDAYARLIGGKYFLAAGKQDGTAYAASTYKDDVTFKVEVAAKDHPVTRGVTDFEIVDENYHGLWVDPAATVLLRTTVATNHPVLAWTRQEQASRVVYLQLGHGPSAYNNPNYRRLLAQAIRWTAKRD